MTKRSILAGLALAAILGACAQPPSGVAYTTPGWYIERPRLLLVSGPRIFAGPFTYEQCESERMKFDGTTAQGLLCILERANPGHFGPYPGTVT